MVMEPFCPEEVALAPRPRRYPSPPDPWVVLCSPALGSGKLRVLDLACGAGRNALWFARQGHRVVGVDSSPERIEAARGYARQQGLEVRLAVARVTAGTVPAGPWGAICVVHFLDRALFPELLDSLPPGGWLIYKTHLTHPLRTADSRPRNPDYLLAPGELWRSFRTLNPLCYREWSENGAVWAGLLARRQSGYSS